MTDENKLEAILLSNKYPKNSKLLNFAKTRYQKVSFTNNLVILQ